MNSKKKLTGIMMFVLVFTIILSSTMAAFGASGKWIKAGNGKWWYRHTDTSYTTNDWEKINNKWYHFDNKGWMQTGWLKIKNQWYYLNPNGDMATGWKKVKGEWYYLNSDGSMQTGWKKVNNEWYFMRKSGEMQTGFIFWKEDCYYLKNNGAMAIDWYKINGDWYYFDHSGAMAFNQWVDNYYVNSNGKWVTDTEIVIKYNVKNVDIKHFDCLPTENTTVSTDNPETIRQLASYVSEAKLTERRIYSTAGGSVYIITFNYTDGTNASFSVLMDENVLTKNYIMYDIDGTQIENLFNTLLEA